MVIDIRAVVENGQLRGVDVPANTGTNIHVTAGDKLVVRIFVTTPDGVPVDSSWTHTMTIRKAISDTFAKAIGQAVVDPDQGVGHWTFTFAPETMAQFVAGTFLFDVWSTGTSGRFPSVLVSSMFVSPSVARSGEQQ